MILYTIVFSVIIYMYNVILKSDGSVTVRAASAVGAVLHNTDINR